MAERTAPFDKPMPELREAFVRARFAQDDVFERPDIEAWLARQREAERPIDHTWRQLIEAGRVRLTAPFDISRMSDLACPQQLPPGFAIAQEGDVSDPLVGVLLESIDRKRVDVLPVHSWLTLFVLRVDGIVSRAFALSPQPVSSGRGAGAGWCTLRVAEDQDFLQAILSRGWTVGSKKIAAAARKFLCDALAEEVKRERAKAEHDFDTAVAVSADGTKIVHADWVCVLGGTDHHATDYRYPADAFRAWKALLAPRPAVPEDESPWRFRFTEDRTVLEFFHKRMARDHANTYGGWWYRMSIASVRQHHPWQRLLYCTDGRILFVHRDQCPFPLPDGGVEVTV